MSSFSSYVTLTYADEFLPYGGTLVLRDLQLFMKRLRKSRKEKIRFYACGEYGDENGRPHYHLLLFNCWFPDRVGIGANKRGDKLYCSKELAELWPWGFNTIGDVTFDSAAYVARYVMKKVDGEKRERINPSTGLKWYEFVDVDGVVHDRLPEFAVMSRRPGIGAGYYEKFGEEVRNNDSVVLDGRTVRPPRFYDGRTDKVAPALLHYLKRERKELAVANRADNTPERLRVKERILTKTLDLKERKL